MRAVLICNEMLGLGHLRLSLALARGIVECEPGSSVLVLTGSPAAGGFALPAGVDVVKLPTSPIDGGSRWGATGRRPATELSLPAERIHALRREITNAVARELRPDVAVVDYRPLGRRGELIDTLRELRAGSVCTLALGLWDVDDDRAALARDWDEALARTVGKLYDLALVYGPSEPDDLRVERLTAHGLPVYNTGLVAPPPAAEGPADLEPGYLLVTVGGGIDGEELLAAVIEAVRLEPVGRPTVLVTGPLMAPDAVRDLRLAARGLAVLVETFRPDMDAVIAGAAAVISMAGYNAVAEVLSSGRPALFAPRTFPRREQLNRALRWQMAGRADLLDRAAWQPTPLRRAIATLLARGPRPPESLTGAADAAAILVETVHRRAAG